MPGFLRANVTPRLLGSCGLLFRALTSLPITHALAQKNDDRDNQQNVDAPSRRETAHQTKQPQNGQNRRDYMHQISSLVCALRFLSSSTK
jgi:hypothetical protein